MFNFEETVECLEQERNSHLGCLVHFIYTLLQHFSLVQNTDLLVQVLFSIIFPSSQSHVQWNRLDNSAGQRHQWLRAAQPVQPARQTAAG